MRTTKWSCTYMQTDWCNHYLVHIFQRYWHATEHWNIIVHLVNMWYLRQNIWLSTAVISSVVPAVERRSTHCYRASSIVRKYKCCTLASHYNEHEAYTLATLQREEEQQLPITWQLVSKYRINVLDVQRAFHITGNNNIWPDAPVKLATAITNNMIRKPKCLSNAFAASLDSETDKGC